MSMRAASTYAERASATSTSSRETTARLLQTVGRDTHASTRRRSAPRACPTGWPPLSVRLSRRLSRRPRRLRRRLRRRRSRRLLLRLLLRRRDAHELRLRPIRRVPDVVIEQLAVSRVNVTGHARRHRRNAIVLDHLLAGRERRIDRLLQRRHAVRDERACRADDLAVDRCAVEAHR